MPKHIATRVTNPETPPMKKTPKRDKKGRFMKTGSSRKGNPAELMGEPTMPLVKKGGGLMAGAFVGFMIANFIDKHVMAKIPSMFRGVGFLATAFVGLLAGAKAQKAAGKEWPVEAATFGILGPLAYKAFGAFKVDVLGAKNGVNDIATSNTLPAGGATAGSRMMFREQNRRAQGLLPGKVMNGMYEPSRSVPGTYMSGAIEMAHSSRSMGTL